MTNDPDLNTGKMGLSIPATRPSRRPAGGLVVVGLREEVIRVGSLDSRPDTTVTGVKTDQSGMAVISFECGLGSASVGGTAGGGNKPRARSEITLDAAHFYFPVDFKQTCREGDRVSTLHTVWANEIEGDFLKRTVTTTTTKVVAGAAVETNVEETQVTDCKFGPVPAREFTLSAFGFPEPPGLPARNTGWPTYVWALIVAGVCAAVVFGLRQWKSRS